MKRTATAFFSFLAFVAFALAPSAAQAQVPAYQQGASQDIIIDGVFSVKLTEQAADQVSVVQTAGGQVQTGVASLNQLATQFNVLSMERIYREAGRFEQRHRKFGLHRWYTVEVPEGTQLQAAVSAFNANAEVTVAEYQLEKDFTDGYKQGGTATRTVEASAASQPAELASRMAVLNDPLYPDQWHYNNTGQDPPGGTPDADIDLPEAHDLEAGSEQVVVSVHDDGLDFNHEDLAANMWVNEGEIPDNGEDDDGNGFVDDYYGYNFAQNQGAINPGDHGTHVGGTVGAVGNNGVGVAGVAGGNGTDPGVQLMSAQVFSSGGNGGFAESYPYAADNGAVISQNSWGYTSEGFFEQAVLDGIDYYIANAGSEPDAAIAGGLVIFSAGNTGSDGELYPGFYDPTIAVASTNINDGLSGFSSYGEWVDVSAPGGTSPSGSSPADVLSTLPGDNYGFFNGTSMAAPHASGVVGLIASASPGLTNDVVRDQLESTTDDISAQNPGFEDLIGTGRVNAFNAVSTLDPDDETNPGAITDLTAMLSAGGNNVELAWTAPADDAGDPSSGPVISYQIAYTTEGPIEDADDFANATLASEAPLPAEPGTEQGTIVTNLDFDAQYWFAVRAIDDNTNSSLSNSASATTQPAPELAYSPEVLTADLELNDETVVPLTLSNEGPVSTELNFTFPAFAADQVLASVPESQHNDVSSVIADASYSDKANDPHAGIGNPITLGAGGPDEFGYEWIDSNESGGPTYNWVDISDAGTGITLNDDDSETVELPFNLSFYGMEYAEITISSNGYLTIGSAGADFSNDEIPSSTEPNGLIAPFWDDLNPSVGGTVYYYDDAENNRFIVQWDGVAGYQGSSGDYTFQAIINDDGSYLFQYEDMEGSGDIESATIGLENAEGSSGLQVAYNTTYIEDGLAVAVAAEPAFIADVSPVSGTIAGGESQVIDVTFSSEDIDEPGLYEDDLTVETNDPDQQVVTIPAEADVATGPPEIAVRPDVVDFGEVLEGGQAIETFYIVNEGGGPLAVEEVSVEGDADAFEVGVFPPSPFPVTVPIGDSVSVNAEFMPPEVGSYSATVTIESDDPSGESATVELTGEGVPAPVIATSPDSLSETLEIGEMATDILTVSNEGGSDLIFEAVFQLAPSDTLNQADVAAPAQSGAPRQGATTDALASASPAGRASGSSVPLDAMDAVYQIDDGTAENSLGFGGLGDTYDAMWLNSFQTVEDAATITSISTAWSCNPDNNSACGNPVIPEGKEGTAYVYDDPNNDGDPSDAVLLTQTTITVQNPGTDAFTTVNVEPTDVEGTFFIAVLLQEVTPNAFPMPMDESSDYQEASWAIAATSAGSFDDENLSNNSTLSLLGDLGSGFPANWLLRADATAGAGAITVVPDSGSVAPGGSQDLEVQYDATGLTAGLYEGNIAITSNDPATPVDLTPVSLDVEFGDAQIVVEPASVDFGEVFVGATETATATIFNEGNAPLVVDEWSIDSDVFTAAAPDSFSVPIGDSIAVDVTFAPEAVQVYSADFTLQTNDPDAPTATIELMGEGVPAPAIATNPDSLSETVAIDQTAMDSLFVINNGGSALDYTVGFSEDVGNPTSRSELAASTRPSGAGRSGAFSSAAPSGSVPSTPIPLDAEDADYQLDDGTVENGLGLTNGGDVMWMNAFEAIDGSANITTLYSAYGSGTGLPDNQSATAYVYEDPNDDGDPSDAEVVAQTDFTLQNPDTGEFTTVDMGGAEVSGTFFIAVLVEDHGAGVYPAPIDESSGSMGASWIVGNGTGDFDAEDLTNNGLPPSLLDDLGFPGNFMVRADAGDGTGGGFPGWISVEPTEGTVAPSDSTELSVTYDATGLEVGTYSGDITIASNDPATPVEEVPVTLTVGTEEYPFALSPDEITVTIDRTDADTTNDVTSEDVTIENLTDLEQFFRIETRAVEGTSPNMLMAPEDRAFVDGLLADFAASAGRQQSGDLSGADNAGVQNTQMRSVQWADRYPGMMAQLQTVGVTAYGSSISFNGEFNGQFVAFDLGEPSALEPVGDAPDAYAGDFLYGEQEQFHIITTANEFQSVDVETGETTTIGATEPSNGGTWSEMSTDPVSGTTYASTTTDLYTIDTETGEATLVGAFDGLGSNEIAIAMAIDADGQMYVHAIDTGPAPDAIYTVDKETGEATLLGSTGVDAGFAQGMDFDPVTGNLYMAWYQGGGVGGLRIVDQETGSTELVGPFQGDEIAYLAIPSSTGFLAVDPALFPGLLRGTLAPNGETTFPVTIDGSSVLAGEYEAEIAVIADSLGGSPEEVIPVTVEVLGDPEAVIEPMTADFGEVFVGDDTTQTVTVINSGIDALEISDITISSDVFSLAGDAETNLTLAPGESVNYTVAFSPDAVTAYEAEFTVVSNDPDGDVSSTLLGEGIPAPELALDPDSFDLTASVGQVFTEILEVTNTGGSDLTYQIMPELVSTPAPEQNVVFEDILLEEDFNDGIPGDWTVDDVFPGEVTWALNTDWEDGNYTGGDGTAAGASSYPQFPGAQYDTRLVTPEIEATAESFSLEFKVNFQEFLGNDTLSVEISTDAGSTWENVAAYGEDVGTLNGEGETITLGLGEYIDEGDTFQVRWRYYDLAGNDNWYAQIDDVVISRELEFLTIDPNAGTLAPSETDEVSLNFDTNGLIAGTYEVDLNITSNDPAQDTTVVPVTLDVIEELTVTPEPGPDSTRTVTVGQEFLVPITVQENLDGFGVQSYQFTLTWNEELFDPLGVETESTLSEDLALAVNTEEDGQISVAAAETGDAAEGLLSGEASGGGPELFELEGSGTLLFVRLQAESTIDTSEVAFSDFMFNEGDPPVGTETTTYAVEMLYGDATLNGEVTAFDGSTVLQYVAGLTDLSDVAFTAAEVSGNGDVTAFDASLIFQYVAGMIDCFPVEDDCGATEDVPALAAKATSGEASSLGTLSWGEPQPVTSSASSSSASQQQDASVAASASEPSGSLVQLPLQVKASSEGAVQAVEFSTEIDPRKASVERVEIASGVPSDWQLAHHVSDDGQLKVAMAGPTALSSQEVATVTLRWKNPESTSYMDKQMSLSGEVVLNEAISQRLERAELSVVPEEFALPGNYPNPFRESTKIGVNLPTDAQVTLEVFDALGRRVLQAERQMEAGTGRTFQINGADLASGVYFYRVRAESEDGSTRSDSGKMILVR